jgi:CrcB protein
MERFLFVALGGALGSTARYATSLATTRWLGGAWPYGTFTVNVVGGFLMGALVGFLAHRGGADQEKWRVLLAVGVLGGFTTFSAFSLESALMIEKRLYGQAFLYVSGSVVFAIAALFAGLLIARKVFA